MIGLLFIVNLEINLNGFWDFLTMVLTTFFSFFLLVNFCHLLRNIFFQKNNIRSNVPVFLPHPPKNSPRMKFFLPCFFYIWLKQVARIHIYIYIYIVKTLIHFYFHSLSIAYTKT